MLDKLKLSKMPGQFKGTVSLSGSKSISNRLLIIRALTDEKAFFENLSSSDDTQRLIRSLGQIQTCSDSRIPLIVDAGNAGTVFRFLTAFLSLQEGKWLLTGSKRMKERPIHPLTEALISLGADIHFPLIKGFPPLQIVGSELNGGLVEVDAGISSQFISALMMIGPYLPEGLTIRAINQPVSWAYVEMTAGLMREFDIEVEITNNQISIPESTYAIHDLRVEPDWSSASYWYEMVALSKNAEVFLPGFVHNSVQGDSICAEVFDQLGVETRFKKDGIHLLNSKPKKDLFEYDFTHCPDLVPATLTTCAALDIKAKLTGVEHLKHKESDRMFCLAVELKKIGAELINEDDQYFLNPGSLKKSSELTFETYDDHRLAMCFAPLVLKFPGIIINNPDVVNKSYPDFWNHIQQLGLANVDKN